MSYLFNGTSDRLSRTALSPYSISVWFYPTDNANDQAIWYNGNSANTRYFEILLQGASDDKVVAASSDGTSLGAVSSTGTVNYNAWNHIYVSHGLVSTTKAFISLNGETLVDGGASSYVAPGALVGPVTLLGRAGAGGAATLHFTGKIAECAMWGDNCINEFDSERHKGLARGFDPRLTPTDPSGVEGLGTLTLTSYSPLIALPHDLVTGTSWTVTTPTVQGSGTSDSHPRIIRNLQE